MRFVSNLFSAKHEGIPAGATGRFGEGEIKEQPLRNRLFFKKGGPKESSF